MPKKVAPAEPEEAPATVEATIARRDAMMDRMQMKEPGGGDPEWNRVMHREPGAKEARAKISQVNEREQARSAAVVDARKMKRFNSLITLRVVQHLPTMPDGGSDVRSFLLETQDSVYLNELTRVVQRRLGTKGKMRLLWLSKSGETVPLDSQRVMEQFCDREWCTMPWVVHVHEDSRAATQALALTDSAKALFDRFDTNNDGLIDATELRRMLEELDRERLQLSETLMHRFIESEFSKTDTDASGALDLREFTGYVTQMTSWMREELMVTAHHKNVFATLAARSIETRLAPRPLPPPEALVPDDDEASGGSTPGGRAAVLRAPKFGLRVEVPEGALPALEGARLGLASLAPQRAAHLFDAEKRRRGEFAFTPVVRLDYVAPPPGGGGDDTDAGAAAGGGEETTEEADATTTGTAKTFDTPLTLVVPHCFSPAEGTESVVLLGAPVGATRWEVLDALSTADMTTPFSLGATHMRVRAPYAGLFCAFSSPEVEDIAQVRPPLPLGASAPPPPCRCSHPLPVPLFLRRCACASSRCPRCPPTGRRRSASTCAPSCPTRSTRCC